MYFVGLDPDISPDEQEEKARLIAQVLELQNTLDGKFAINFALFNSKSFFIKNDFSRFITKSR